MTHMYGQSWEYTHIYEYVGIYMCVCERVRFNERVKKDKGPMYVHEIKVK